MYFDYTGGGSCFQVLSVAGKPNCQDSGHKDGCCQERICEIMPRNNGRPDGNSQRQFDEKCYDMDNGRPFPPQQCCDNGDCCKDGTAAVLSMAMRALGRNDTVDIEVTLSGGYTQVITLSRGGSSIISGDIIKTPQGAISVCEITKIRVISSSANDPEYMDRLQNELQNFIHRCMRQHHDCDFNGSSCDDCVEAMQNYIMRNANDIDTLLFDGAQTATAQIITGTTSRQLVETAELTTESASFVASAELSTDTAEVVTGISVSADEIVTEVGVLTASLVSAVTTETTEVSGPVTVTDTEVVSAVEVTTASEFAGDVTVTPSFVIGSVTTETADVVSGFTGPETVEGVVSGLTAVSAVGTTAFNIPIIAAAGTGALQVVIPAGAFGTNIPAADVTLDVTVGGTGINFGGTATAYGFTEETTLLGEVEGAPVVSNISTLGTAVTTEVVTAVTSDAAEVVGTVEFTAVSGALVTGVTTAEVGSAQAAEPVTVVSAVTAEFSDINGVGEVTSVASDELITTDTAAVVAAAELAATSANAVTSAVLETTEAAAISGVTTESVLVASPNFAEDIDGEIIGARCGIVAVDNTDGDISVYSSCSIKGTQTGAVGQ